jgi:hypothetical protein
LALGTTQAAFRPFYLVSSRDSPAGSQSWRSLNSTAIVFPSPTSDHSICPYLLAPWFRSDMPMTNLEIRVAALQFLSLRLCAALSLEQLEEIRQSTLDGVRASDVESMQMQSEFLKLLDDAIERARQKQAATSEIKSSVHLA